MLRYALASEYAKREVRLSSFSPSSSSLMVFPPRSRINTFLLTDLMWNSLVGLDAVFQKIGSLNLKLLPSAWEALVLGKD